MVTVHVRGSAGDDRALPQGAAAIHLTQMGGGESNNMKGSQMSRRNNNDTDSTVAAEWADAIDERHHEIAQETDSAVDLVDSANEPVSTGEPGEPVSTGEPGEPVSTGEPGEPVDHAANFRAAFMAALETRDDATGTLPAVAIDAIKQAVWALPRAGKVRDTLPATVASALMTEAFASGDPSLPRAVNDGQVAAIAAAADSPQKVVKPNVDPTEQHRSNLDTLAALIAGTFATIPDSPTDGTDDPFSAYRGIMAAVSSLTPSDDAFDRASKLVDKVAVTPRKRSTGSTGGTKQPGRDIAQAIRDALATVPAGTALKCSAIVKLTGLPSVGAVDARHVKDNVDGARATTLDGSKAFVAA